MAKKLNHLGGTKSRQVAKKSGNKVDKGKKQPLDRGH